MILNDKQAYDYLSSNDKNIAELIKKVYQDGYDQAIEDCEHLEDTGIMVI